MKKRLAKMVAMATAMVLVIGSNSLAAMAADNGTAADGPQGGEGNKLSSGAAIASWDKTDVNQTGFNVVGDDDNTAADGTDTSTDISIWAKVVEHGDIVYKVDISWGAMKFEFNNQAGKWDTTQHKYVVEENQAGAEWTEKDYIDATNNKITVVNHSNWAVDTTFTYAHDGAAFNEEQDGDDAVRGHFFLSNEAAKAAAKVLENSDTVLNALEEALTLGHQDATHKAMYGGTISGTDMSLTGDDAIVSAVERNTNGSCTRDVYFTFNGTPDIEILNENIRTNFTKVGVITVTIEPWEE